MLKEFDLKNENRSISLDLNDISLIDHCRFEYDENVEYVINVMTKSGFERPVYRTESYKNSRDFYENLLQAYKESQNQLDTEKRLKAYIEQIDNKIATEVKKYLDKITGK